MCLHTLSESEELLAKISTTQFTHLTVTSDLSQLAVTTNSKHILLVSLPDYFEVIPYSGKLLRVKTFANWMK